jgi:hypothetical protein
MPSNKQTKREKELKKEVEKKEQELIKQKKITKSLQKEASTFKKEFASRTLKLMTSGFGLVSALAWNELIKEIVSQYIKPFFGESSGLISLVIYAVFITALAVFITYQLGKFAENQD